jgi:hypothetical protein
LCFSKTHLQNDFGRIFFSRDFRGAASGGGGFAVGIAQAKEGLRVLGKDGNVPLPQVRLGLYRARGLRFRRMPQVRIQKFKAQILNFFRIFLLS